MFESKKSAKTAVSRLRRELQALVKAPAELTHGECLTLMAKALGFKSWNELAAKLPDAPVTEAPSAGSTPLKYPAPRLSNTDGRFDFIAANEPGTAYGPRLEALQGTSEALAGVADIETTRRDSAGVLDIQFGGDTKIFWNDQHTVREDGERVWVTENDFFLKESMLVLLPEGYTGDPYGDPALPVRHALLDAYKAFLTAEGLQFEDLPNRELCLSQLAAVRYVLGFGLTQKEELELFAQLAPDETQGPNGR